MTTTTTPNMGLILPVPSSEAGPAYAEELITALETVDTHNHTSGSGVRIPISAITVDTDLSFNGYNATSVRSVRLSNNSAVLATPLDLNCVYSVSGDLWYNTNAGTPIQITSGNAINVSSLRGIGGDYLTSTTADIYYTASTKTFAFWADTNLFADIDCGGITVHQTGVTSAPGVSLLSPVGLGASYTLTLPAALPSPTKFLTLDSSGNIGNAITGDGTTISITGTTMSIPDGGISRAKLAALNIGSQANTSTALSSMTLSITTLGRPVMVILTPDGVDRGAVSSISAGTFQINRAGSYILKSYNGSAFYNKTIMFVDTPAAGTYTYACAGSPTVVGYKLICYELV
jgi:hypothetical protein